MKRLLLALCFLLGSVPAFSQIEPVTFRPITGYTILNITNTAGTNSIKAFDAQTRFARVVCSVNCFVAFLVTPINAALSTPVFLPALVPEYFVVGAGQYVRVKSDTATGTLYVTEMGR